MLAWCRPQTPKTGYSRACPSPGGPKMTRAAIGFPHGCAGHVRQTCRGCSCGAPLGVPLAIRVRERQDECRAKTRRTSRRVTAGTASCGRTNLVRRSPGVMPPAGSRGSINPLELRDGRRQRPHRYMPICGGRLAWQWSRPHMSALSTASPCCAATRKRTTLSYVPRSHAARKCSGGRLVHDPRMRARPTTHGETLGCWAMSPSPSTLVERQQLRL
jgi:hypothetical protein